MVSCPWPMPPMLVRCIVVIPNVVIEWLPEIKFTNGISNVNVVFPTSTVLTIVTVACRPNAVSSTVISSPVKFSARWVS